MINEPDDLEKVERNVRLEWENLHAEFPEGERTSAAYLAGFNHIHSWEKVHSSAALGIPFAGRFADAAVDAKTSVRLLELILERQSRMEQKVTQMHKKVMLLSNLSVVGFGTLIGYAFFQWFSG